MFMLALWVASIIGTIVIVDKKKLGGVGYFFLALFTGPLAFFIVLLMPDRSAETQAPQNLEEARRQLLQLKSLAFSMDARIKNLEALIGRLSGTPAAPVQQTQATAPALDIVTPPATAPIPAAPKKTDMEMDFGRNWLSKIGVAVLALGIAFLISYSFKYFGPFLKIAFGYLVAAGLFFAGSRLETKERLMNFGRVLLGGAWAITYFTTYAMHHFEGSRLISNQMVDLFLLALVVAGMMAHVLKYKSETMTALALFVAYFTSTIGQITSFTVLSSLMLAVLILVLVYKFQWVRILTFGILMTYGLHYLWIGPKLEMTAPLEDPGLMNYIFLSCYWLVFGAGIHLLRSITDPSLVRMMAGMNFTNIVLYGILSYSLVLELFYAQRFWMVLAQGLTYLGLAALMKIRGRQQMYVSDLVAGVFALTFALSIKFLPTTTLLLWMIEAPCLIMIGVYNKEKIYRLLGYGLALLVGVRIVFLNNMHMPPVDFLGFHCTWFGFMCFWAAVSMALCFWLMQTFKRDQTLEKDDRIFDVYSSVAFCLYLTMWVSSFVHRPWSRLALLLLAVLFFGLDLIFKLRRFRICAYAAVLWGVMVFFFAPFWQQPLGLAKSLIVTAEVTIVLGLYYALKVLQQRKMCRAIFAQEQDLAFFAGVAMLVFAVVHYVSASWISLSLGVASAAFLLTGFLSGNKTERLGGMLLLALSLGRVVLVDLSGLDIVFKIITLIVLGILFIGVSYIYNRYGQKS